MNRAQANVSIRLELPSSIYRFCEQYAKMQGISVDEYLVWAIENDTMQTIKELSNEEIAALLGVKSKEGSNSCLDRPD